MPKIVTEQQPSIADAKQALASALSPRLAPARQALQRLRQHPPQVLLLEGGTSEERFALALWQAAYLNCPHATPEGPCLDCPVCLQVGAGLFQNIHLLDGRTGNISIASVRETRASVAEAPYGDGYRTILLVEAQALRAEAANALLKVLEEPRPRVCFLLLAPQRDRLLPTLVSRGWTLTLPWPIPDASDETIPPELHEWASALRTFLSTGRDFLKLTSVKGGVDAELALRLVLLLQKSLSASRTLPPKGQGTLARSLSILSAQDFVCACDLLAQCQRSLNAAVKPSLVLEWMAVRLYILLRKSRARLYQKR